MYSSFTDENADSKIFLILNYKQGIWDSVVLLLFWDTRTEWKAE